MSETRTWWAKSVLLTNVSEETLKPKSVGPKWERLNRITPWMVVKSRMRYSFEVLLFGRTKVDAKYRQKNITRY